MSKVVLGKGLEALIRPDGEKTKTQQRLKYLPLEELAPNPHQPRHDFDDTSLHELAQSIKVNGIIQPLIVKATQSGYIIIAGERRFRASKLAGIKEVPVVLIDDVDDNRMLELALIENVQREDLNVLEVAEAYKALIEKCSLTQQQLSEKIGKSRTSVTNVMRLLTLPESIKIMIQDGRLSEGHARAILAIETEEEMLKLAHRIVTESLSVRVVEKKVGEKKRSKPTPKVISPEIVDVENKLKQIMGTSVKINHGLKKGKIEIEYYGVEDLNRLLDLFNKMM